MGYTQATYNGIPINITRMGVTKNQKTIKQKLGKSLVQINIVGNGSQQYELNITGIIFGTTSANLDTNRSALIALNTASAYPYTDGIQTGTFIIIPDSLKFEDDAESSHGHYKYNMTLVQQ